MNKRTNIPMDEQKDENYIPLGINAGGIIIRNMGYHIFSHLSCLNQHPGETQISLGIHTV